MTCWRAWKAQQNSPFQIPCCTSTVAVRAAEDETSPVMRLWAKLSLPKWSRLNQLDSDNENTHSANVSRNWVNFSTAPPTLTTIHPPGKIKENCWLLPLAWCAAKNKLRITGGPWYYNLRVKYFKYIKPFNGIRKKWTWGCSWSILSWKETQHLNLNVPGCLLILLDKIIHWIHPWNLKIENTSTW